MPSEPGCARLIFATWPGGENSTREHFLREKKDRQKFPIYGIYLLVGGGGWELYRSVSCVLILEKVGRTSTVVL